MPVRKNPGKGGARNAGHRQLDKSDTEKAVDTAGMLAIAAHRARLATQAIQSVLDGGQDGNGSGVSILGVLFKANDFFQLPNSVVDCVQ